MNERTYNALFGARVKYYRSLLKMTQKELADKLGYTSSAAISSIEKGNQTIPLSKLMDFCVALHIQPYDLLGLRDEDKKIWAIAEKFEDKDPADLVKFAELYFKLLEGK